jgi:hypothetical protein
MKQTAKGPLYLMRWDHSRDQRLDRDLVVTTHRLAELPLFSNDGLTEILDRYPREALAVSTMGHNPVYRSQSQTGELGNHSGIELVDMIRRGRLCLRLKNLVEHHAELARIVGRLCSEMVECQPGLRTSDHNGELEISSPTAITYYRYDRKPSVFWQIHGSRTISTYPAGEPFVSARVFEETIARGGPATLYFEPAFDDQARQWLQSKCDVLALLQHTPYRIVNGESLCVTLKTNYHTPQSRRRNETHRANHVLKRFIAPCGAETEGIGSFLKRTLLRGCGSHEYAQYSPAEPTFRVDPDAPLCVGSLDPPADQPGTTVPSFPGLQFETSISASAVTES